MLSQHHVTHQHFHSAGGLTGTAITAVIASSTFAVLLKQFDTITVSNWVAQTEDEVPVTVPERDPERAWYEN